MKGLELLIFLIMMGEVKAPAVIKVKRISTKQLDRLSYFGTKVIIKGGYSE